MSDRPQVAIVYHFFAHYRAGVNQALLQSEQFRYLFVGDTVDPLSAGIEPWAMPADTPFLRTRSRFVKGRFLFQSGVIRLALRRDIDAIIFLGDPQFATTWPAALLARLTGKRVFFWTHGWTQPEGGLKGRIRQAFYRLAHGLMLYGHHAKVIGQRLGFLAEKLHVIYNSLDYPAQRAARAAVSPQQVDAVRSELFAHPARPLLLCTSRLIAVRRLDLLLEAMLKLREDGIETNLLLIGDGPERARLTRLAEEHALDVHFYGACYDETVISTLVMAADATVAPGKVGLTAMHSLAYGTPVFTHGDADDQMPEWEAILPGYNGGLFTRDDSADLARVLRDWLQGAPGRETVRQRCYEVIDRFYNPEHQRACIEHALRGEPADDAAWEQFQHDRQAPDARQQKERT